MMQFVKNLLPVASSLSLPPKSVHGLCPALQFEQAMSETNGRSVITFQTSPTHDLEFVDVHVVLEGADGQAIQLKNFKMLPAQKGVWKLEGLEGLEDAKQGRPDVGLKYSFTYCVKVEGSPVDCDTEAFANESFEWQPGDWPSCPSACGLSPSVVTRDLACFDTVSGRPGPAERCAALPRPQTERNCPATEPCVTFEWREALIECPEECGVSAFEIPVPISCVGSDGTIYDKQQCSNLPAPAPIQCPATDPCVSYFWKAQPVQCPTECGLEASQFFPDAVCTGSDGRSYPNDNCADIARPGEANCPATDPCVSFAWKSKPVQCPIDCGLEATQLLPDAVCIGSDGRSYPKDNCAELARPGMVKCPATEDCVSFSWKSKSVQCPTDCGLEASEVLPDSICIGSDGRSYPNDNCANVARPGSVDCPATDPCVTFGWKSKPVQCPIDCGLEASQTLPDAVCIGSDGRSYPNDNCAELARPGMVNCPATDPCVTYDWVAKSFKCPTECGLEASQQTLAAQCIGSDGLLYADHYCADRPAPIVSCPATESCVSFDWVGGLAEECPTECGLEASTIYPQATCKGDDGSFAEPSQCDQSNHPAPIFCPATEPCVFPTSCPALEYDQTAQRVGQGIAIQFTPRGANVHKRHIEWVDLHFAVEDMNGEVLVPKSNVRMDQGQVWSFTIGSPEALSQVTSGRRLVYSFTYCVDMVDCDTRTYFFTPSL